jgi:hypothetical protein
MRLTFGPTHHSPEWQEKGLGHPRRQQSLICHRFVRGEATALPGKNTVEKKIYFASEGRALAAPWETAADTRLA